jgi:hypothetical protein
MNSRAGFATLFGCGAAGGFLGALAFAGVARLRRGS